MKGLYFLLFLNANCYTIWLDSESASELDDNELFDHNDSDLKTMKIQPNNYQIRPSPSPTPVEEMTFYSDEGKREITKLDKKTYKDIAAMNSYDPYMYFRYMYFRYVYGDYDSLSSQRTDVDGSFFTLSSLVHMLIRKERRKEALEEFLSRLHQQVRYINNFW